VWSGLPSISEISGGKFPHVWHFDGKAVVTEYGRQAGVPFVDVQAGAYGTNFFNLPFAPEKQSDGSFALQLPVNPTTAIPFIDTTLDYGIFVRYVLELPVFPDGGELAAYAENISVKDLTRQWSQGTRQHLIVLSVELNYYAKQPLGRTSRSHKSLWRSSNNGSKAQASRRTLSSICRRRWSPGTSLDVSTSQNSDRLIG
jgi:hypothetical protein